MQNLNNFASYHILQRKLFFLSIFCENAILDFNLISAAVFFDNPTSNINSVSNYLMLDFIIHPYITSRCFSCSLSLFYAENKSNYSWKMRMCLTRSGPILFQLDNKTQTYACYTFYLLLFFFHSVNSPICFALMICLPSINLAFRSKAIVNCLWTNLMFANEIEKKNYTHFNLVRFENNSDWFWD